MGVASPGEDCYLPPPLQPLRPARRKSLLPTAAVARCPVRAGAPVHQRSPSPDHPKTLSSDEFRMAFRRPS